MRKNLCILALAVAPALCLAQNAIDGTWKMDAATFKVPDRPSKYLVNQGTYECLSCKPLIKVKPDGAGQPLKHPYFDTLAVKIVDDRTIELVSGREGKETGRSKVVISADGKTLTRESSSVETSGITTASKMAYERVGAAPKGAHAMSGTWRPQKIESMTETTVTFKVANGALAMSSQEGGNYEARLDGSKATMKGDPGTQAVSVKMKGKDFFEETAYRADGKAFLVTTMKVAPDGKKANVTWMNLDTKARGSYTLMKQ